jgi:tRNA_anti-like
MRRLLLVLTGILALVVCSIFVISRGKATAGPVQDETNSVPGASNPQLGLDDEVIRINAFELLSAYQRDEEAAKARFTNKKVEVTGVLTGVFIPSLEVSMRVAEKGGSADAFVTMGGPRPTSVEETMFLPGIHAASEERSLFGQHSMDTVSDKLVVGSGVTMLCTVRSSIRVSDMVVKQHQDDPDYSIDLDDCTLRGGKAASSEREENVQTPEQTNINADNYVPGTALPIHPAMSSNAAPSTSSAGSVETNELFQVGGNVTPPVVLRAVEAEFSDQARREKYQGDCFISLEQNQGSYTQS